MMTIGEFLQEFGQLPSAYQPVDEGPLVVYHTVDGLVNVFYPAAAVNHWRVISGNGTGTLEDEDATAILCAVDDEPGYEELRALLVAALKDRK